MIKPEIKNLAKVQTQIEKWQGRIEAISGEVARGLSVELFQRMVENSPQWSGDFAANWRYAINAVDYTFEEGDVPSKATGAGREFEPWKQFDRPAVQMGKAKNRGKDASFRIGDTAFISNSASHDEAYARGIHDGSVKLRDVNRRVSLQGVVADFNSTYGKVLSSNQVMKLRKRRIT